LAETVPLCHSPNSYYEHQEDLCSVT